MVDFTASFQAEWVTTLIPSRSKPKEVILDLVSAGISAKDPLGLIAASRSDVDVPLEWLPYLAEERSVDEFSSAWPEARQRAAAAESMAFHRVKGIRPAMNRAIEPLGYAIKVFEWFEKVPTRPPHTFRLSLTLDAATAWMGENRATVIRVANKAKPLHTKLEALEIRRPTPPAVVFIGGVPRRRRYLRVGQVPKPTTISQTTFIFIAAVQRRQRTIRVGPRL